MKRLLLIAGISTAFAATTPALAMSDAECAAAWTKAVLITQDPQPASGAGMA